MGRVKDEADRELYFNKRPGWKAIGLPPGNNVWRSASLRIQRIRTNSGLIARPLPFAPKETIREKRGMTIGLPRQPPKEDGPMPRNPEVQAPEECYNTTLLYLRKGTRIRTWGEFGLFDTDLGKSGP